MMQYLKSYKDRHGKQRHYIRKAGFKAVVITSRLGTKDFDRQYEEGLCRLEPLPPRRPRPRKPRALTVAVPRWLRRRTGGVYFVKGGEQIKIGYSGDIKSRIGELQIGSPVAIEFVGAMVGADRETERDLHAEFAEYRVRGEWFKYGPRLAEFIALVRTNRRHVLSTPRVAP